ncbi:MAG TPA: TlpA disulfide reductase family protein [Thermoanaerobaculia bacterium]|nr:TlpA disulfide reductase family protein [Thermoanaerobaculia bacterium]
MKRALIAVLLVAACARGEKRAAATATQEKPPARTEVGDVMPAYDATLLDGTPLKLQSEKGNVVLLNVWATWCGPCRFEIPELEAMHQKYAAKGFRVIGVSVDDTGVAGVKQFVAENKITYPIAVDADGRVATILSTTVLPTTVIIGRDGRILWRKIGAMMPNEIPSVDSVVEQALAKKG